MELFFREHWKDNYLGKEFQKYNELYDITIEKYGHDLDDARVVFVEDPTEYMTTTIDLDVVKSIFNVYGYPNTELVHYNSWVDVPEEMYDNKTFFIYVEQRQKKSYLFNDIWDKSLSDVTGTVQAFRESNDEDYMTGIMAG